MEDKSWQLAIYYLNLAVKTKTYDIKLDIFIWNYICK